MEDNPNIDIEVLFFRYCNDKVTAEEKENVEKLVSDSEKAAEELELVKSAVGIQRKIDQMESVDISTGLTNVRNTIRKNAHRKMFLSIMSRVAAILVLPLLITSLTLGYIVFEKNSKSITYAELVSAPGTIASFELPDKSKVWLNSNSKLRYPACFEGDVREVELEGEGYFEVESDKSHPFYVKTPSGIKIMAHGTHFSVSMQGNMIETTLAEGKVSLLDNNNVMKELYPAQQALYNNETGELEIIEVNLQEKLAWKDGKIIFRNAPLEKVFEQLSKRYNVDIVLHDEHNLSEKYSSRRVTFTNETIQQILSYLQIAAPLKWKMSPTIYNSDSTLGKQRIDVWLRKE
jgi:ferric-dicitrate binding protein FerR (iron transport regulator)